MSAGFESTEESVTLSDAPLRLAYKLSENIWTKFLSKTYLMYDTELQRPKYIYSMLESNIYLTQLINQNSCETNPIHLTFEIP